MAGPLLVSIVYSVVPICAVIIGFLVIRKDYLPRPEDSEHPVPGSASNEEV